MQQQVILSDFVLEDLAASEPLRVGGDVIAPRRSAGDSSGLEPIFSQYDQTVCIVQTVVNRHGRLEQIELLKPENCAPRPKEILLGMFDSWRYQPATLHGEPAAVVYHLTVDHCPCLQRD